LRALAPGYAWLEDGETAPAVAELLKGEARQLRAAAAVETPISFRMSCDQILLVDRAAELAGVKRSAIMRIAVEAVSRAVALGETGFLEDLIIQAQRNAADV
jgi:hypothetical protein